MNTVSWDDFAPHIRKDLIGDIEQRITALEKSQQNLKEHVLRETNLNLRRIAALEEDKDFYAGLSGMFEDLTERIAALEKGVNMNMEAYGPIFKEPERRIAALDGIVSKLLTTVQNQDRRFDVLDKELVRALERIAAVEDSLRRTNNDGAHQERRIALFEADLKGRIAALEEKLKCTLMKLG